MTEALAKHLEFIQGVVNRLAGNSFLLKGWSVTLAAGLFALAARDSDGRVAVIAIFPALSFWGLDAYYLRQERLFRALYNDVVERSNGAYAPVEFFSISTSIYEARVQSWTRTLFSHSVFSIHAVVLGAVLCAAVAL